MVNLVYEFEYDGKRRVSVITSKEKKKLSFRTEQVQYKAFDFIIGEFRTFNEDKMKNVKFVSDVKILPFDAKLANRYEDDGGTVFTNELLNIMYIVKLKQ